MAEPTKAELQHANAVAKAAADAVDQLEQAGRGLHVAYSACRANTADLSTATVLAAVIAYASDAQRLLLEVHAITQERYVPKLVVPR